MRHLDSATGLTAFWVDGRRSVFQIYKKGLSIRPGGTVLLGQDPDTYVSTFDADQSFVGEITDVQMLDYVLSGCQIKAVYSNQEPYVQKGNMLDWNTIKYEITGNVVVAQTYWFWSGITSHSCVRVCNLFICFNDLPSCKG